MSIKHNQRIYTISYIYSETFDIECIKKRIKIQVKIKPVKFFTTIVISFI